MKSAGWRHILPWFVAALVSCGGPSGSEEDPDGPGGGGKADGVDAVALVDGTPPAVGLLRFVNDPGTTVEVLREQADVPATAATNLVAVRDGDGRAAPDPFDRVAEVDAVPGVGPVSIQRMLDFAVAAGFVPEGAEELGSYDGVTFTVDQAAGVIVLVNTASEVELDVDIALDARAVAAILEVRPISSVLALSELSFVDQSALEKLRLRAEGGPAGEIGVVSDLDDTIVPPAPSGQTLPDAPYPGIAELLTALESGDGSGAAGDVHYVTARQPAAVTDIPDWLADHGVPAGDISTGISGIPNVARGEKIRDITALFDSHPGQRFVMFGDTAHVDPDAYRAIRETFGDRVAVAFIHDVEEIEPSRLEGLFLVANYAEAAAELLRIGALTEEQARAVMEAVVAGGEITEQELEELIEANRPG
ncbi:MAG TPA: phosphatase domain-containing protein [Kofleriaceae bacterium]|nr:phosphatase domain-containing protein [Kofleriaceae bacterium]